MFKMKVKVCDINTIKDFEKFDTKELKDIITTNRSFSYYDMKALNCFFATFGNNVLEYVKKSKLIGVDSISGDVKIVDIFDNQIIVKTAKTKETEDDIKREYKYGMNYMNKLRQFVPNFVYTLGRIREGGSSKLLLEKINGYKGKTMNRKRRIKCLCMLIIALVKSEREVKFSHKDLHEDNFIVKDVKPINYQVNIGLRSYVINTNFVPVIIDYGQSDFKGSVSKVNSVSKYYKGYDTYQLFQTLDLLDIFEEYYGMEFVEQPDNMDYYYNINPLHILVYLMKNYQVDGIKIKERDVFFNYDTNLTHTTYNKLFFLKMTEQANKVLKCSKCKNKIVYDHCRFIAKKFYSNNTPKRKVNKKIDLKNTNVSEVLDLLYKSREMNKYKELFREFLNSNDYKKLFDNDVAKFPKKLY